jgi:phosphate:Na+ symporter
MESMESPLLGILAGAAFTGLIQSSAATTGIAIVMASEGLVTLPAGIALALGANIGTCVTALLASLGKPREAQRAAAAHVLFNVLGVVLWVAFLDPLARLATSLSPSHPELEGTARLAAEVPRQIANANTLFNVINTALFLPLTGVFARIVTRLLPERSKSEEALARPKFLDEELLDTPSLALERVRLEFGHLGSLVLRMWDRLARAFLEREREGFDEVARMDDGVDRLHGAIVGYLGRLRRREMTVAESQSFLELLGAVNHLETIGDVLETNLVAEGHTMLDQGIRPSETMRVSLGSLWQTVLRAVGLSVKAVVEGDEEAAREVLRLRKEINPQIDELLRYQASRLSESEKRVEILHLEMSVVDSLKRTYTLAKRMAKLVLRAAEAGAGTGRA